MIDPRIVEKLASYAHEAWCGWIHYQFGKSFVTPEGDLRIPRESYLRWKRQAETYYHDLPEGEKESDRAEARKMLEIVDPSHRKWADDVLEYPRRIAVYVASPYTLGDTLENVQRQISMGHELMTLGYCAVLPLLSHYQDEQFPHPWEEWMVQSIEKLRRCDVLLRMYGKSKGADIEIEVAHRLGIPIMYSLTQLHTEHPPVMDAHYMGRGQG